MAIAAMVAWVLTASIGVYMLRTWVVRGGLRRQRATGVGVPPTVLPAKLMSEPVSPKTGSLNVT